MSVRINIRYRSLVLLTAMCSFAFLLLPYCIVFEEKINNNGFIPDSHPSNIDINNEGAYSIQTEGCTIPALKPFDKHVIKLMQEPFKFTPCIKRKPLLKKNGTHFRIIIENLKHYYNLTNITQQISLTCCYQPFNRPLSINNITAFDVDHRVKYEPCVNFSASIAVNSKHEFVRVTCFVGEDKVYHNFFLFTPKKNIVSHDGSAEIKQNNSVYNVMVLGLDSVSRQHFYRAMPKTLKYVKNLGAVELLGYNKIGDNTFPNAIALLVGIKEEELKKTCYPHRNSKFDNCPFIWEWFKQAGFYTAFGEDSSLGIFNYEKSGFFNSPTDYYPHNFMYEARQYENIYKKCLHGKYAYQIQLDYIDSLTATLNSSKLFSFFWESHISHDYIQDSKALDVGYKNILQRLNSSNYLNQTILFLLSDHGLRFGGIVYTQRGRLEMRLPFVYVIVPQSFREKYARAYSNLKLNSRRLVTPLDVHATLSDLVNLKNIQDENILLRSKDYYTKERAISLFLPIPGNRTCKAAGIDDHWCSCHQGKQISIQGTQARKASQFIIRQLNNLLSSQRQCARLKIARIIEAMEMTTKYAKDKLFRVVVEASPGGGVFEATLRSDNGKWVLAGTVGRLNRYGEQSSCIDVYNLKLYCYCH